jgi:hypothetical protein
VKAVLTIISSALRLEISDSTVDAWELLLEDAYDEDLRQATLNVLKGWETGFLPPPGLILKESRLVTHQRMKSIDADRRIAEGKLTKLKELTSDGPLTDGEILNRLKRKSKSGDVFDPRDVSILGGDPSL